jgi:hypothetical protein
MKMRMARALLIATVAMVSCSKSASTDLDAGPHGPTNIVVKWTIDGKAASTASCKARNAAQVYINLSGTIDTELHQSVTIDCAKGTTTFESLLVEKLGMPYIEGTLLDDKGVTVNDMDLGLAEAGVNLMPIPGTTNVTLAFYPPPSGTGGAGGMGASSSSTVASSSSTVASSSSSGGGGMGGGSAASSSSAGAGGADAGP